MTEKRFYSESNCVGYYTDIIDEQKKLDLTIPNPKKNLVIEELVDLLNTLHEENIMLKEQLSEQKDVEWLRNNTVWEVMPTSRKTYTTTNNK